MFEVIAIILLFGFLFVRTIILDIRISRIENSVYPALRNRRK
jgi:hypothetical protein